MDFKAFTSVQFSRSVVSDSATPWTEAHQASPEPTQTPLSMESVMPISHLIFCRPLLPPSISTSIRVHSNESVLCIRWPKYWSFSFSPSPSSDYSGLISFRPGWISLQSKGLLRVFSNPTAHNHQFFGFL